MRRRYHCKRQTLHTHKQASKVKKLTAEVHFLENQNQEMKEQIAEILDGKAVKRFHNGRYSDVIHELCYSLLAKGVSTREVGPTIQKTLKMFANINLERFPKKSVASSMLVECEQVG